MAVTIQKAQRKQAKLRVGLFGPSGSGKTMSALKLARGLAGDWEKVVIIDTENASAHLYSHLGPYSVIDVRAPYTPEKYIEALRAAEQAGFDAIIIDSITHEWAGEGGILELADSLSKDSKNSYTVWGKLTPRHNKFIEGILQSSAHVICCGRSKQEYALNQVEKNGKTISVPEKMGLKAVTREGFDYEMTVAFELAISHYATSTKDRTSIFQDKPEHIIDEQTGERLKAWNESGAVDIAAMRKEVFLQYRRLGIDLPPAQDIPLFMRTSVVNLTGLEWSEATLPEIIKVLKSLEDSEVAKELAYGKPRKQDEPEPEPEAPAEPTEEELAAIME